MKKLEIKEIKATYKSNYSIIQQSLMEIQSIYFKDFYNKNNSNMDNVNIVLYFAKNLHERILRQKDYDLDYDISLQNFWTNYSKTIRLPKETARRKIQELVKLKILKINNNKIFWKPFENDKISYDKYISTCINHFAGYIETISICLNIKLDMENIKKEIKNNFSFYWFHYLNTQLKYLKIWKNKFKDLEEFLILLQFSIQENKINVKNNISWFNVFKPNKNDKNIEISATLISSVTGIPRSTCIRKLEKMTIKKILMKHPKTKKYYSNIQGNKQMFDDEKISAHVIDLFSELYFIILKRFLRNDKNLILKS